MKNNIKRKIKSLFLIPILAGAAITTPIILTSCGTQINTDSNDQNIDNQQQTSKLEIITSQNPLTLQELVENTFIDIVERYVNFNKGNESTKQQPKGFATNELKNDISSGIISKFTKVMNKEFNLTSLAIDGNGEISFPKQGTEPNQKPSFLSIKVKFTINNEEKSGHLLIWSSIIDRDDLYIFSQMIKNAYKQYTDDQLVKEIYDEFIGENESFLKELKKAYLHKGGLIALGATIVINEVSTPPNTSPPSTVVINIPLSFDGKYRFVEYK